MIKSKIVKVLSTAALSISILFTGQTQFSYVEALTSADFGISQEGVDFICSTEGFSSTCYWDNSQSSIGYGTKCMGSPIQPHESGLHSITREKALADMRSQINATYAPRVRRQTRGITMNQNQFDALVSFCYNTGGGDYLISASPLVQFLQGKLSEPEARRQYSQYCVKAGEKVLQGLINRRNREAELFFSGRPLCQKEWKVDGHTYRFYSGKTTWSGAKKWCEEHGGYLATITSEREQKELSKNISEYSKLWAYLGAENTSGSWKWVTGEPFEYSNWRDGEPNCVGNKEFYLGILKYGEDGVYSKLWNDFPNDDPGIDGFIFESGDTPLCKYDFLIIDERWTSEKVSSETFQRVVNILINKYEARYGKQEGMSYKILKQLAYLYVDKSLKFKINVGVAWSQAIMETDAFTFSNPNGSSVKNRNYGGLIGPDGQPRSFKNNEEAVNEHIKELYNFAINNGGTLATVNKMTNKWNKVENYGKNLNKLINEMWPD